MSIQIYEQNLENTPPVSLEEMSDDDVIKEITSLKKELQEEVLFLGHHYQSDEIIQFADITGDSLALAQKATQANAPYIIFCGVHFMAETADMLTSKEQQVILPDLQAGCSMADMAQLRDIEKAWDFFQEHTSEKIIPITYINCSAELKAFVGKNDGSICTSSNAKKMITWALERGEKLLFFPDQHLGRNTCHDLGIALEDMVVYNPHYYQGGLTPEQIQNAKVILWYGYCSVHKGFTLEHIKEIRKNAPETQVLVHPECDFSVVESADLNGSTAFIIKTVAEAPAGSSFAIGTEINLVQRLAKKYPDKNIISLSPYQCLCTTMYRVRPRWLLHALKSIQNKKPINVIRVPEETQKYSLLALERMLSIS